MNIILMSISCIVVLSVQQLQISSKRTDLSVDPAFQLKPGKGIELVQGNCMPCHSTAIVAANHMTREGWSKTIDTMQKKNGMWPLSPVMKEQLLDYLETAQRIEDPGLEEGKRSPWATPLYRPNPLWK